MIRVTLLLILTLAASVYGGHLNKNESVFAVITHKGGVARGLAHDHFIHASEVTAELEGKSLEDLALQFSFAVSGLKIDDPAQTKIWFPALQKMGIQNETFSQHPEGRLQKIHNAMWSRKQLNLEKFPKISARLVEAKATPMTVGKHSFPLTLTVAITIAGQTKNTLFGANIEYNDGAMKLEAAAKARFTDFGMEPYSAMLGAVSNEDEFYFYVNFSTDQ